MSLLITCQDVSKSYGHKDLFKDLSLSIFTNDQIGLIGPNGSGKSTLLKMICGLEKVDSGTITKRKDLTIGYVEQSCEFPAKSPYDILWDTLKNDLKMTDYEKDHLIQVWLSNLGFMGDEPTADLLSGGWKKRLAMARELLHSPDLLILDEPTNHLDLEGLVWIEKFLKRKVPSYLLVSHDRYFLENTVNKVMEISPAYPKGIFSIEGTYANFLEKKSDFLDGQLQQERSIASKARREKEWLSQSPQARTTKSKSRIEEANHILNELGEIKKRNRQKISDIDFAASDRKTRKLMVVKNLRKEMDGRLLFDGLDVLLSPGVRIGLVGPNGSGKTTFLRLLAGEILPDGGTLKPADQLKVVYFDQHRSLLSGDTSLRDALSPKGEFVTFRGKQIHVNGWCKRFLFNPENLDMPIAKLSGGERARISIAHLLLQPADILLLDEPTNDLDIPTLETLEESLLDFGGAVVLITHDRCMIDRICNVVIGFGDPQNMEQYADFVQWEAAQKKTKEVSKSSAKSKPVPKIEMTYAEKREYDQIEIKISKIEEEIKGLNHLLENSEITENPKRLDEVCRAVALGETEIEQLYLRWDVLEKKKNFSSSSDMTSSS